MTLILCSIFPIWYDDYFDGDADHWDDDDDDDDDEDKFFEWYYSYKKRRFRR